MDLISIGNDLTYVIAHFVKLREPFIELVEMNGFNQ
jgi:hypothetical protein